MKAKGADMIDLMTVLRRCEPEALVREALGLAMLGSSILVLFMLP
jgi:hypothetical protein